MISNNEKDLLYVHPYHPRYSEPIIDILTKKITYAIRNSVYSDCYFGDFVDFCNCYSSQDFYLESGHKTHALAIHYVAFHRRDIPRKQRDIIKQLEGEACPTTLELWPNKDVCSLTQEEELLHKKLANTRTQQHKIYREIKNLKDKWVDRLVWNKYINNKEPTYCQGSGYVRIKNYKIYLENFEDKDHTNWWEKFHSDGIRLENISYWDIKL